MPISIRNEGVNPIYQSGQTGSAQSSTAPQKGSLPAIKSKRLEAASNDLKLSFKVIKGLVLSPFSSLFQKSGGSIDKPKRSGEDIAQAIIFTALLPATVPATLVGAALLTPIALVSATVALATGKLVKPPRADIPQSPPSNSPLDV